MLTSRLIGRQRPLAYGCPADTPPGESCHWRENHTSFIGGHAEMTFLGASLVCAHHVHNPWLYGGDPAAGATACGAGLGVATAVTALRILADRHWVSDLVVGAVVGSTIGWLVPLLHYALLPRVHADTDVVVVPSASADGAGLSVSGTL